jgi:hypothetical protein
MRFVILLTTAAAIQVEFGTNKHHIAMTTPFLVDFNGPKHNEVTVSAGAVGGADAMSSGWGKLAVACADVSSGSGVRGISYRLSTRDTHVFVGWASTNATDFRKYDFSVYMKDGQHVAYASGQRDVPAYRGTHSTSAGAEDDLWSIEINPQGNVEFKQNGMTYYTSPNAVVYPWHVIVDMYNSPGVSTAMPGTAVHEISYIGGEPEVTFPSTACGTDWPTPERARAPRVNIAGSSVSASGDPHMTSVTGAKFDILRSGNHTLLHIPQHSLLEGALVFVRASVKHEGPTCLDMYIESLHITGKWADERQRGGFSFFANQSGGVSEGWLSLGKLDLKVVHGTTVSGVRYLNMFARHLAKLGMPIGGILGLDGHESAATPEVGCQRRIALWSTPGANILSSFPAEGSDGHGSWAAFGDGETRMNAGPWENTF